jgi:hypothetical protein
MAYMLCYERIHADGSLYPVSVQVPEELGNSVGASNEELRILRRILHVHKQMIELNIYYHMKHRGGSLLSPGQDDSAIDGANDKCTLFLLSSTTLEEALTLAHQQFNLVTGGGGSSLDRCRLRRYNPVTNRVGETYGSRENQTLEALGLMPSSVMLLERRSVDDAPFIEFNPREMQIKLVIWDSSSTDTAQFVSVSVIVPGEDLATVAGLRAEAINSTGFDSSKFSQVVMILNNERSLLELSDDSKLLKRDHGICSGDEIVIDFKPVGAADPYTSAALTALREKRKTVHLFFNHPQEQAMQDGNPTATYNNSLEVSLDNSLSDIKVRIASQLGISVDDFHFRRNAMAPQLRDEHKSLADLSFVDQSVLHLQVLLY